MSQAEFALTQHVDLEQTVANDDAIRLTTPIGLAPMVVLIVPQLDDVGDAATRIRMRVVVVVVV